MRNSNLLSRRRSLILKALAATTLALIVACSGGDSTPEVAPTSAPAPAVVQDPAPTQVPAEAALTEPTAAPVPTPSPTAAAPTATPPPSPTPAPIPTATPYISNVFDDYGFTLQMDQDITYASANLLVTGWTELEASNDQGLMVFEYNGANIVMFWEPENGNSPQTVVDSTYELQKLSQPNVTFTPISEGDLAVDGQAGRFGGYVTQNVSGGNAGGGLIGAWACEQTGTSISLTATGSDATALQIRFDRLTSGFECGI